jgi:hypothetical protein
MKDDKVARLKVLIEGNISQVADSGKWLVCVVAGIREKTNIITSFTA